MSRYADDLVIFESLEELQEKLILWKSSMEGQVIRVHMDRPRVLISEPGLDVLQKCASWVSEMLLYVRLCVTYTGGVVSTTFGTNR